jgi:hypothetical protein
MSEWVSVLRLATRWNFPTFRELALEKLESIEPSVDKLVLARELNVTDWLIPSYVALCLRPEPLTLVEAEQLKMADVVLIFTAREGLKGETGVKSATKYIKKLLAPSTKPAATSGADSQDVPQQSSRKDGSNKASNAEHVTISQAITNALRYHAYEEAIGFIVETNKDDAAFAIAAWANTDVGVRGESSLKCFVTGIFRRCAQDASFVTCAVFVLNRLLESADKNLRDDHRPEYYIAGGQRVIRLLLEQSSECIIHENYTRFKDTLLGSDVLSSSVDISRRELYCKRRRNALVLVRELVRTQAIEKPNLANLISIANIPPHKLYSEIVSLSPIFDIPEVADSVKNALGTIHKNLSAKRCDDRYTIDLKTEDWAELRVGDLIRE